MIFTKLVSQYDLLLLSRESFSVKGENILLILGPNSFWYKNSAGFNNFKSE